MITNKKWHSTDIDKWIPNRTELTYPASLPALLVPESFHLRKSRQIFENRCTVKGHWGQLICGTGDILGIDCLDTILMWGFFYFVIYTVELILWDHYCLWGPSALHSQNDKSDHWGSNEASRPPCRSDYRVWLQVGRPGCLKYVCIPFLGPYSRFWRSENSRHTLRKKVLLKQNQVLAKMVYQTKFWSL